MAKVTIFLLVGNKI